MKKSLDDGVIIHSTLESGEDQSLFEVKSVTRKTE